MVLLIVSVSLVISITFLCSLMEACLLSLSNADVARISEKYPRAGATWKHFKANIHKPIAVILISNTFAHTIGASVAGAQFDSLFGSKWIGLFSVGLSFAMIQWAEILPKTMGIRYNKTLATVSAVPMKVLIAILNPILIITEIFNRPFEKKSSGKESAAGEISVLAHSAALENQISKQQEHLITGSVQLSIKTAKDIMVPRKSINTLDVTMTLSDALIASHVHHHTRFPLTVNNNIDEIIGYVNFKDIVGALHLNPVNPTMEGIKRNVLYVSEDTKLREVLSKLTRGYQHMAVVRDKNGKTVGLITLEDLIEMLVGELVDEYDTPPELLVQLSETRFRAGGAVTFAHLKSHAFSGLPDWNKTIDQWIKETLAGAVPIEGRQFVQGDFIFTVRKVTRGNVYDVIVDKKLNVTVS